MVKMKENKAGKYTLATHAQAAHRELNASSSFVIL